jgi:hypothetical protein
MSTNQRRIELKKAINRNDHFTLSMKRPLKQLTDEAFDAIEAAEKASAAGLSAIQLYGSDLLSGSVTWISGLIFEVSECRYIIDDVIYTSQPTTITLDAADGSNDRIDVIYVDTGGLAGNITGTAAADPAKPEVDQNTQLELTFVNVAQSATTPTGISVTTLYAEDAGDPGEWDATESTSAARIDLNSTNEAYAGTKTIEFISAVNDDTATLTAGAGNELTLGDMDFLECHVYPTTWGKSKRLRVAFFSGANRISNWVLIRDGSFGFDRTNPSFQTVTIPSGDFAFTAPVADSMQFEVSGGGGSISCYLDQVRAQTGGGIDNSSGFTEEEMINNVRTWNAQQPFGADALTDGASIAWDLDVSPIATVTLDGNRTLANPTNIRAGGTYILKVKQDDTTGSRTLAYGSAFLWPGGTAPTLSTAVDSEDVLTFVSFDGTNLYSASNLDFS